jgi:hypothetical protein
MCLPEILLNNSKFVLYQKRRKAPAFRHKAQKIRKDFLVMDLHYTAACGMLLKQYIENQKNM